MNKNKNLLCINNELKEKLRAKKLVKTINYNFNMNIRN